MWFFISIVLEFPAGSLAVLSVLLGQLECPWEQAVLGAGFGSFHSLAVSYFTGRNSWATGICPENFAVIMNMEKSAVWQARSHRCLKIKNFNFKEFFSVSESLCVVFQVG